MNAHRRSHRSPLLLVVAALIVGGSLAACADDEADPTGGTTRGTTGDTTPGEPVLGATSLGALLAAAPALDVGDESLYLTFGDLDAVSDLLGAPRPTAADDDEGVKWAMAISSDRSDDGSQAAVALLPRLAVMSGALMTEMEAELGWQLGDVAAFLEISGGPDQVTLVTGDVTEADLAGVGSAAGGIWNVGEGDDYTLDVDQRSPVRPTGAPLHLAWSEGIALVSRSTSAATAFAAGGPGLLDGEPALAAVAAPLAALDPHGALLVRPASPGDWYDAVAAAQSVIDGQRIATIVYHPTAGVTADALAAEARAGLERETPFRSDVPWTVAFPGTDVAVVGDVVVVSLPLAPTTAPDVVWASVQATGLPVPG